MLNCYKFYGLSTGLVLMTCDHFVVYCQDVCKCVHMPGENVDCGQKRGKHCQSDQCLARVKDVPRLLTGVHVCVSSRLPAAVTSQQDFPFPMRHTLHVIPDMDL